MENTVLGAHLIIEDLTRLPVPVILFNLLLVHLVHLETTLASLAISLTHVSLHVGSSLASLVRFVGIESVPVAIVPPGVFVLLIVSVNLKM